MQNVRQCPALFCQRCEDVWGVNLKLRTLKELPGALLPGRYLVSRITTAGIASFFRYGAGESDNVNHDDSESGRGGSYG